MVVESCEATMVYFFCGFAVRRENKASLLGERMFFSCVGI